MLIALYDDKPVVKVIDFGVAKATGGALTEHTIYTGFGEVVGTLQYMSPEQASFEERAGQEGAARDPAGRAGRGAAAARH